MPRIEEESGARTKSRWRIPPPLLRDPGVPGPTGIFVVREISSPLGTLLWTLLRGAQLRYARTTGGESDGGGGSESDGGAFPPELVERRSAELEAVLTNGGGELEGPLRLLVRALAHKGAPGRAKTAGALERIAVWAAREGHARTSIECLQTAAIVYPGEARYPLRVAGAVAALGQPGRAESWLQRAIGVARRRSDWGPYVEAYAMHGQMMLARGALPAARTSLTKALRRSIRQGNRVHEASVRSAFFRMERLEGNHREAGAHGASALDAFHPDHPGLPAFALEVAHALAAAGAWQDALALLAELPHRLSGGERADALGLQARASGEVGNARVFRRAHQGLDRLWTAPANAEPWAEATRGAVALGDPERSLRLARRTEAMARRMGESLERYSAESLLAAIEEERRADGDAESAGVELNRRLKALRAIAESLERLLRLAPLPEPPRRRARAQHRSVESPTVTGEA